MNWDKNEMKQNKQLNQMTQGDKCVCMLVGQIS